MKNSTRFAEIAQAYYNAGQYDKARIYWNKSAVEAELEAEGTVELSFNMDESIPLPECAGKAEHIRLPHSTALEVVQLIQDCYPAAAVRTRTGSMVTVGGDISEEEYQEVYAHITSLLH